MLPMTNLLINQTGKSSIPAWNASRERKVVASLQLYHRNRPRVLNLVNDNYCVKCVTELKDCVCVPGQRGLNPSQVTVKDRDLTNKTETVNSLVNSCVANAHFIIRWPQKKSVNPNYCHNFTEIKYVKDVSCVGRCHRSTCRGKATPVLGKVGNPGGESKGSNSTQRWLHPSIPVQTQPNRSPTVISIYTNLTKISTFWRSCISW